MDRRAWLDERRAATRAVYDAEAAGYDADDYPHDDQVGCVARVLERCLPGGLVLDAPCGTGRYFAQVRAAGFRVVGIDQSAGMLAEARARGLAERLDQVGLQELAFERAFDAVFTIDAMEIVPPEDWPTVLSGSRACRRLARGCRARDPGRDFPGGQRGLGIPPLPAPAAVMNVRRLVTTHRG
jgi:SAM-dependent methyltransferase